MATTDDSLNRTPLDALHLELGARMVPFAGYAMPLQYEGIIAGRGSARDSSTSRIWARRS
jgi:aminomethyltransferase